MDKEFIQGQDVMKLMMQFCKEHNLVKTFNSLREETDIKENFVKDVEGFQKAFRSGTWDDVLLELNDMVIPRGLLMDVFELILFELCEAEEYDLSKYIVKEVLVHKRMIWVTKRSRSE
jgi:WD40 repeat-containing protein SMU1